MYNSPNSLDINIKNTNNTNTHINFNFNIGSRLDKKFLSPALKSSKDPPSSITGRKIEQNNILNYESSSLTKYPILIEDSKKKTSVKPLLLSKKSPKLKTQSMGKLSAVKLLEKAKMSKKNNNFLSPPPPDKDQEKAKLTLKETIKLKKKGKKKGSSKKKKHQVSSKEINQSPTLGDLAHFQDFIHQNLKKYQMEKLVTQQRKNEEIKQKDIKQQSLHHQNKEIRKLNSHAQSMHRTHNSAPKFPWGFNQKKYISFFEKMAELNSQKSLRKKPISLWLDEKTRRERLGLGFLNEMNFDDFQKFLQKQKQETAPQEQPENKKSQKESNPEILNWMNSKKKRFEEERWNTIKGMLEEQQRIRKNIQDLEMKAAYSRISVKSSTTGAINNNNRSKYAKSSHNMGKQQMEERNPSEGLAQNDENKIYDLLQKQFQQMVYGSSNRNDQTNEFSTVKHVKSKSQDFHGKILQKKKNIQEQFQILSQKMAHNLGVIKNKSKSPSPEQEKNQDFYQDKPKNPSLTSNNPNKPTIIQDNTKTPAFTKEHPPKKNPPKMNLFRNPEKITINPQNQNQMKTTPKNENTSNKEHSEQSPSFSDHSNLNSHQTPLKKGKNPFDDSNRYPEQEEMFMEKQTMQFSSEEEEMIFIINTAATLIQKVWKGYHTRKMLNYYVLMALKEMNPEISHSPIQENNNQNDESLSPSTKAANKNLRRSHSLDEIYEPGNLFQEKEKKNEQNNEKMKEEGVFNEQEREELDKKLKLLNNKTGEDFDYYQLGGKNEEIQFDIKSSENLPKLIDNNLFYGKKNEQNEGKILPKIISGENEVFVKKDLDKSEHIMNLSHLNEDNLNKQGMLSDKNIQISNIASMNTMINFQERKESLENEQEEIKTIFEDSKRNTDEIKEKKKDPEMKWEEFLEYMKLCCQKKELNETATKFLDILQNLPVVNLKGIINSSEFKDESIQTNIPNIISSKNTEENIKKEETEVGQMKPPRKNSKNLQIEIESDEENEKAAEKEKNAKKEKKTEQKDEKPIKNDPVNKKTEKFEKNDKTEERPFITKNEDKFQRNEQLEFFEKPIKSPIEEIKVSYDSNEKTHKIDLIRKISKQPVPLELLEQKNLQIEDEVPSFISKIGDLRRAVGSEKLLRAQSLSWNPSPAGNKTPTIFDQEPFREFTNKKIHEFLNKENMLSLIRFREKALLLRHQAQIDHMKKMLENKRVSPRTFKSKSEEIEKWVISEREDMMRKKIEIEKGWLSAALTMRRTQRDLMFMRKSLGNKDKMEFMEFKHSYSEEDFQLFEGLEEKARSSLEIQQINKLEIQDEVLKASNEKNKENKENDLLMEKHPEVLVKKFNLEENLSGNMNFEANVNSFVNKQLTSESVSTNSPKILIDGFKNPLEPFKSLSEISKPSLENIKIISENNINFTKPLKTNNLDFEAIKEKKLLIEKKEEVKGNENVDGLESIKQKISEIPKFLSHDDFGNYNLSVSSSLGSLSNSKSDMTFLTSKNNELNKKIDQVSGLIFEQLIEELKNEGNMFDLFKGKKITLPNAQKSPKVGGFVAGKDIQEHFPPLNSPSREDVMGNKRFKDQILSPKNLNQYRVKSEPDEKVAKGGQGIFTNIEAVKEYSNELIELIKRKYRDQFLKNMNVPLGLVPLEKLKLLQLNLINDTTSSSEAYENSYMYPAFYKEPILGVEIFTDLEKVLFKKDCLANKKRIYELQQIHNKAIFDSFNEALDLLRPYGLKGRPSPWKPFSRQIVFRPIDDRGLVEILNKAKDKLMEWSSNLCGFIHDKEESQFLEGILLDDECLGQIREDRMARMLAQEVIECEEDWVEYGDEETEVEVELGDLIFEKMVLDGIESVLYLKEKRQELGYFNQFST